MVERGAQNALGDLLEVAPVMALLVDAQQQVRDANAAARDFFQLDPGRLPLSVLEATREGRIDDFLRRRRPEGEVRLVHRTRVVAVRAVPGPHHGQQVLFLSDVTELDRLRRVRQEFVANLAHELKTPLTSLRLAAESLEDVPLPARQRFLDRVLAEADQLGAIIDNLRQLTEIESGRIEVAHDQVDVDTLLRTVAERLGERPKVLVCEPGLVLVADRAKLTQALGNLVDNAAKFSPTNKPIELTAQRLPGEVRFTVRDRGTGISPEHWERVWERFYKVDPARSREVPGTGLGLAITKHLVLAMGGRVWTEAAPGGGQLFGLALPALNRVIRKG